MFVFVRFDIFFAFIVCHPNRWSILKRMKQISKRSLTQCIGTLCVSVDAFVYFSLFFFLVHLPSFTLRSIWYVKAFSASQWNIIENCTIHERTILICIWSKYCILHSINAIYWWWHVVFLTFLQMEIQFKQSLQDKKHFKSVSRIENLFTSNFCILLIFFSQPQEVNWKHICCPLISSVLCRLWRVFVFLSSAFAKSRRSWKARFLRRKS